MDVISAFSRSLAETSPIFHAVKFEDPLLQAELAERAVEIFALEMKLRRVLSIIYLHTNQEGDPFNLLSEEIEQPVGNPRQNQMQAANENQFFHLTFGQYINLNQRPQFSPADIFKLIRDAEQYFDLREEILRVPVKHQEDANFIIGLKEVLSPIERMRNCVAHNRRPTSRIAANYPNARLMLEERLDSYLARWEVQQ